MLERDLQRYLFEHPEVLFPGQTVQDKSQEFYVRGKRIDLLFRIDDVSYIIELKAVPLGREHIGQVVEYYGLMRESMADCAFKMVLVAPLIPPFRSRFLQEIGIRCVEIPDLPATAEGAERIRKQSLAQKKQEQAEAELSASRPQRTSIAYHELVSPVTKQSLAISHLLQRDTVDAVRKAFSEYETVPVKMQRSESGHVICGRSLVREEYAPEFISGGAWWAYAFGYSEQMPKNDMPNISAEAMPWSLDLAVNAELQPSQRVMRDKIAGNQNTFDVLVKEHGDLQFRALLKLEHQPRTYHWIPLVAKDAGTWNGKDILDAYEQVERGYEGQRDRWIAWVEMHTPRLSRRQALHMRSHNKRPNLALRLIRPFRQEDNFWVGTYSNQRDSIIAECSRLKPFIDFFL